MNKVPIYFLLSKIILLFSGVALAQDIDVSKVVSENNEWSEGTITLSDGTTISGLLNLNTRTGLLAYENGATSRTFTPRKVLAFEFFDVLQNKKRSFLSVNYKDSTAPEKNVLGGVKNKKVVPEQDAPKFFEIQMEFKTFALLSFKEQLQIKAKGGAAPAYHDPVTNTWNPGFDNRSVEYSQTETLFIFDTNGNITPLLAVTDKEIDAGIFDRQNTKTKRIDDEIIEHHTSPHFGKLEKYAKENKLSFKKKDDLLKILEYYKTIESD